MSSSDGRILIGAEAIQARVAELGKQISSDYATRSQPLMLVGILKGSFLFLADLCRSIQLPVEIDFIAISSYEGQSESSGVVRIIQDLEANISDRDVLIVEDIIDTGLTIDYLLRNLRTRNPRSVEVCTLLDKSAGRSSDHSELSLAYVGFSIPDEFVIGYGMDLDQRYRNLPYVASCSGQALTASRAPLEEPNC